MCSKKKPKASKCKTTIKFKYIGVKMARQNEKLMNKYSGFIKRDKCISILPHFLLLWVFMMEINITCILILSVPQR